MPIGSPRPNAGQTPVPLAQLRDAAIDVLAMLSGDVDADARRLARSVRCLRAYAVAVANDPAHPPSAAQARRLLPPAA